MKINEMEGVPSYVISTNVVCTSSNFFTKVRSLLDHSCAMLISFKTVVIFNITWADFVLMSADVVLKMTTILKEMRSTQLCSKSEQTLASQIISCIFLLCSGVWPKIATQYILIWGEMGDFKLIIYTIFRASSLSDAKTKLFWYPSLDFKGPVLSRHDLSSPFCQDGWNGHASLSPALQSPMIEIMRICFAII